MELNLTAKPHSWVSLVAVDKAVHILKDRAGLPDFFSQKTVRQ